MPCIRDIFDAEQWKKIQDNFSAITNVGIRTLDSAGKLFVPASGQPRLCTELFKNKPEFCEACVPPSMNTIGTGARIVSFSCIPQLHNFVSPIKLENMVLGYLIVGPMILLIRHPKEHYRAIAKDLGVDIDDFWSAIVELKVVSMQRAYALMDLMKDIADYIVRLSFQKMDEKRQLLLKGAPRVDKLCNTLLDVAIQVSGADIGSIMFYDSAKQTFTIKSSRGLSEEVVKKSNVKIGDGIAGLAAKEKVSFLINEDQTDNRIKPYLTRPSIKSSMIIPLKVEERVMGVMNLGTSEANRVRFDVNNLKVVNKLVDLAAVAFYE